MFFKLNVFLVLFIVYTEQHSYNLGECPLVAPQSDFRMENMLGEWFVIKKTSTSSSCIIYNFTSTSEPNHYQLEQISNTFIPLKHNYHYTGELIVQDPTVPAKMKVKFPLNLGSASYTVFMTDYQNYAAIFTCQKLPLSNRQSVSILSRKKVLDKLYLDKIQQRMSSFGVNPYDLSIINQNDCKKNIDGYNWNVDDDTFSVKSVAGVIRKAGEKIGDGFEYVAEGAKKLINKGGDETKQVERRVGQVAIDPDAEWIP
ncbi:apolipoprotein D-like [Onthophagus taurus]|uniref:apolipoprotein D-like n=1 Tax=Onthophagus taurus TaxID=166361 RepID=UPI000C209395|nr:apolipoprotein D-like [Onthophagus taurus]